ncbi:MAG: hypothetical protein P8M80_12130 [Pirellulaceae bacterium]|nr:hypothetical protein [Pirellulaceae bacterium]
MLVFTAGYAIWESFVLDEIMIVDDEVFNTKIVRTFLQNAG